MFRFAKLFLTISCLCLMLVVGSSAHAQTLGTGSNLNISKVSDRPVFKVGTTVNYLIKIANVGIGPSVGTSVIADTFPTGIVPIGTFSVSPTPNNGGCSFSGQAMECYVQDTLYPNDKFVFTIPVKVTSSASNLVKNCATVYGAFDGDLNDNISCVINTVQ